MDDPRAGRFLSADVRGFLEKVWQRVPGLLAEDDLQRIPTLGNRHNVFLGALTVAAYHALLERGLTPSYACELGADMGWKIYEQMLRVPVALARLRTSDPQQRMNVALREMMRFPFSTPGEPGYAGKAWSCGDEFHTDWTYCAPHGFVSRYVQRHGDRGEIEAFYQSWCLYDWPAADILSGAKAGERGHYRRLHALSRGDSVCDMCWSASANAPGGSRHSAAPQPGAVWARGLIDRLLVGRVGTRGGILDAASTPNSARR